MAVSSIWATVPVKSACSQIKLRSFPATQRWLESSKCCLKDAGTETQQVKVTQESNQWAVGHVGHSEPTPVGLWYLGMLRMTSLAFLETKYRHGGNGWAFPWTWLHLAPSNDKKPLLGSGCKSPSSVWILLYVTGVMTDMPWPPRNGQAFPATWEVLLGPRLSQTFLREEEHSLQSSQENPDMSKREC